MTKIVMTNAEKNLIIRNQVEYLKIQQHKLKSAPLEQCDTLITNINKIINRIIDINFTEEDFKKLILDTFMDSIKLLCENYKNFKNASDAFMSIKKKDNFIVWKCLNSSNHFHVLDKDFTIPDGYKNRTVKKINYFYAERIISGSQQQSLLRMLDNALVTLRILIVNSAIPFSDDGLSTLKKKGRKTKTSKYDANSIQKDILVEFYRCGRKRFFILEKDAQEEAMIVSQEINSEMNAYACKYCSAFHIGHTSNAIHKDPRRERLIEVWNSYSSKNYSFLLEKGLVK
jgi:hypothetical protein